MTYIWLYKEFKENSHFNFKYKRMLERFKDIESILTKNNFISKNQITLKGSVKTKTVTFKRRLNDNDLDISIKYFENKLNLEKFKKIKADIFIFFWKKIFEKVRK